MEDIHPLNRIIVKINMSIIFVCIVIGVIYLFYVKVMRYSDTNLEATSTLNKILQQKDKIEKDKNGYLDVAKKFDGVKKDFYYNFKLMSNYEKYIVIAEPKEEYLREKDIEPKIFYIEISRDNNKVVKSWEN